MTGRPSKSLLEHVEDGTFRARDPNHEQLLESAPLVASTSLASIQRRYRRAKRPETLRRIAGEFERAVNARTPTETYEDDEDGPSLKQILDELGPKGSAERVINFFPRFLRHFKGPLAGQPFELEEWQKRDLRLIFKQRDGRRVYSRVYWIIPGGNGKTPVAAAIGLLGMCELTDAPEIYCLAGAKDQSDIAHKFARDWIEGDEDAPGELSRWLRIRGRRILNKSTKGEMLVLASSGPRLEGKDPSIVIVDELHAFETKLQEQSYQALSGKLHKRPGWLLAISTAGRGEMNILRRIIKAALKNGKVSRRGYRTVASDEESGLLLIMYAAPKEAPLKGKAGLEVIRKANPASWIDPRDIIQMLADEGAGESELRRLARNEWVAARNPWMQPGMWDKCEDLKRAPPAAGASVVLGFDGSYNNDSTALIGCTPDRHVFVVDVWEKPEDDESWVVPRDEVNDAVDAAMKRWKVERLVADPPGWHDEIRKWGELYEEVLLVVQPTNERVMMAQACKEFYGDVEYKRLTHDGDKRLARHIANAHARETPDGAYIVKDRRDSPNKIDAAVAAVLAHFNATKIKPKKRKRVVAWS